jgi:hypothetical protein
MYCKLRLCHADLRLPMQFRLPDRRCLSYTAISNRPTVTDNVWNPSHCSCLQRALLTLVGHALIGAQDQNGVYSIKDPSIVIRHPSDFSQLWLCRARVCVFVFGKSEEHILATTLVGTHLKVTQDKVHLDVRACAEDRGDQVECHIGQLGYVKP